MTIMTVNEVFNVGDDNVDAINLAIQQAKSYEIYLQLANYKNYLGDMLSKDYIQNDGRSLVSYSDAVDAVNAYMGLS